MFEDTKTDAVLDEKRVTKFRLSVEEFAFRSPQTSPVRRSPRSSVQRTSTSDHESARSVSESPGSLSKKRALVVDNDSFAKAKKKRGYAAPETYSHLDYLTDCLGEYLDVLFCGINPGVHSATVGHHFAHPGNRFYRMLHGSGFTDRLVPAEEDNTLPSLYQIGITDLVDRPSSCEGELSSEEMVESVPSLLQKVVKYRPRIVCFIGKGMGQKVERGFKRAIVRGGVSNTLQDTAALIQSPRTPRKQKKEASLTKSSGTSSEARVDSGIGLRPFKVTHADATSSVRETLFFCSHSSSGLATSMNLQGKIDVLKELRELVLKHKAGTLDTSSLEEVPV